MRYPCFTCGKSVTTELPDTAIVRALLTCPECLIQVPSLRMLDAGEPTISGPEYAARAAALALRVGGRVPHGLLVPVPLSDLVALVEFAERVCELATISHPELSTQRLPRQR
jgi:hypothetical protein